MDYFAKLERKKNVRKGDRKERKNIKIKNGRRDNKEKQEQKIGRDKIGKKENKRRTEGGKGNGKD